MVKDEGCIIFKSIWIPKYPFTETPDTSYTTNGLEIDPLTLHNLDDTKYLTKLHDPTTLVSPSLDQQNKIIKSITESELNRYIAKGNHYFR